MSEEKEKVMMCLKKRRVKPVGVLCFMTCSAFAVLAQNGSFERLDAIINSELKETNTPGAAVVIVKADRMVFSNGFGRANVETNEPATAEMLFRTGSMTKMFTALTLLSLVAEGKVKLDEPVGKYLKGLTPRIALITFHLLLTHTSGIRDEGRPYGPHDESALRDAARNIKDDYLFTEPGQIFSYSNLNYVLVGAAMEEIAAKPYADSVSERLLKPLGMTRTTFRPTEAMTWPLAQGHNARGDAQPAVVRPFTDNVAGWPAGFLFSSANDLARFALAFLNRGMLDGKQPIAQTNIGAMSAASVDIPGIPVKYGYGLRVEYIRGVPIVGHGGAIPGFGAQILMSPEHRVAVIVLTNKSGARLEKTVETALEMMLPLKTKPEAKPKPSLTIPDEEMRSLVGMYSHSPRQFFEIVVQQGKLFLKDEEDLLPLQKIGVNRFLMRQGNAPEPEDVTFVTGKDGKPAYLHINGRAFRKAANEKK